MAWCIAIIYLMLGIGWVVVCELLDAFDTAIEEIEELGDNYELDDYSSMIVKLLVEMIYMILWPITLVISIIYGYNAYQNEKEKNE